MPTLVQQGWKSRIAIGLETTPGTPVATTVSLRYSSETFSENVEKIVVPGLTGTRTRALNRRATGTRAHNGGFTVEGIRPTDLALLLQAVTGKAATPFTPQASLPSFTIEVYLAASKLTYTGCKICRMMLESSRGAQPLRATFDNIYAMSMTRTTAAVPATPAYGASVPPLVHKNLVCTLGGTAFKPEMLRIVYDNQCDPNIFRNSETRLEIPEGQYAITGSLSLDPDASYFTNLYTAYLNNTSLAIVATWTSLTTSLACTIPNATFDPDAMPTVANPNPILVDIGWEAFDSVDDTSDAISFGLDDVV